MYLVDDVQLVQTSKTLSTGYCKHENQKYPPSLFSSGKVKQGIRSSWIETKKDSTVANTPSVEVTFMEGAAVVHFFQLGNQICKRRIHPTCVFWNLENTMHELRLGCIAKRQSETFNDGKRVTGICKRLSSNARSVLFILALSLVD